LFIDVFLPRDATLSAAMPQYVVCQYVWPSVRLSVMFRYRDHVRWNSSKIIPRQICLRYLLSFTPTWAIWSKRKTPKI